MQTAILMNSETKDNYGLKLLGSMIVLLLLLAYTSFYLMQNYYSKSFLEFNLSGKKIYFLESKSLKSMYEKNGMDYDSYKKRVDYFKELALKNRYDSLDITSKDLSTIDKKSKLIILDMMSLSATELNDIESFVSKGGRVIFNFTSGFLDTNLQYQKNNLVTRITDLSLDEDVNTVKYDRNATAYVSTKLLSPLTQYLPEGNALELALYDPLPIFDTPSNLEADAYLTNWTQVNYLNITKNRELSKKQSGLVWHGYKGEGKWVYFSFPSYAFIEVSPSKFANLFKGMLEYLDSDIIIRTYPYLDAKNVVFVSEDTEYKYENLQQFHDVAEKNHFPVTAFCVVNLAEKNKKMMESVSKSKYLEIGSHSYTHKKIVGQSDEVYTKETIGSKKALYDLTKQKISGFRPPREEIDDKMINLLEDGGFHYILSAGENRLTPHYMGDIMIIPRHGTDDYSYLINLDWSASEILKEMEHEVNVIADLNGMYTMSTHTHLMSFSSNINITDKFFQYINKHKEFTPMNGEMLYKKITQKKNISFETKVTLKKLIMTINNDNSEVIKDINYEIYIDSNVKMKNIESEIIGVKTELIKVNDNEYRLIIKEMKPKSQLVLFLNYEKIS
jgi:peptidoglycan/xylan/chitin deacetylase (PgdA/CDA1 family)